MVLLKDEQDGRLILKPKVHNMSIKLEFRLMDQNVI